jgi:hypothetical protein
VQRALLKKAQILLETPSEACRVGNKHGPHTTSFHLFKDPEIAASVRGSCAGEPEVLVHDFDLVRFPTPGFGKSSLAALVLGRATVVSYLEF